MSYDVSKQPDEVRKIISYPPEDACAYKNLTGMEYLQFIVDLFNPKENTWMVEKGVAIAALGERINDRIDTYSKGMKRCLLVGRTLMTNPRVAVLDEPTTGLDGVNTQEIREIIKSTTNQGTTVLLSSHNMFEMEFFCDHVALIAEGRIVEQGGTEGFDGEIQSNQC